MFPQISNFTFNIWLSSTPGYYTFVALARDTEGFTNASAPVTILIDPPWGTPPTADITGLVNSTTHFTTLVATNYPVVRDGIFQGLGSAQDTDVTDVVSYQLVLRRPGEANDFADVMPGALNYFGLYQSTNNIGDNNGDLGTINLSGVPNGAYDLILRVRSNGDQVTDSVRITVESQLKIIAFSFSEQDLVIPVNGIPVTVIRTYDSMNPVNADFGYNWTYALNDLDVIIEEYRESHTKAYKTWLKQFEASIHFSFGRCAVGASHGGIAVVQL